MRSTIRFFAVLALILVRFANASAADPLDLLREAVANIELGTYDEAARKVEAVLIADERNPLGHMVLGTIYLHVGRLDQAEAEYASVLQEKTDEWRAHYAMGIISLLKGRRADADKHMALARQQAHNAEDFETLTSYLHYLSGEPVIGATNPVSDLEKQIQAMALIKKGSLKEAASLLAEITRNPAPPGFEEFRAPLVTFEAHRPIALPGGKLTWKQSEHKDAPIVSGEVQLTADASRTSNVAFIAYYVDDLCVGVTNCYPYRMSWDTTRHTNGLHQIRVEGQDSFGRTITSKTMWVRVANKEPAKRVILSGQEADELWERIWRCIRLTESRKLVHYQLARLFERAGDRENAVRNYEYAAAYDPDYADTRKKLLELTGRKPGYAEVHSGPTGSKMIALTFDDGPNERTIETLDILSRYGVPATFFLVGFRAEAQPNLVKAICDAGHEIENHTYSHPNLTTLTTREAEIELAKCNAVIRAITGKACKYFRPPGGHSDEATKQAAAHYGLIGVYWTVNCSPWEGQSHVMLATNVIANATDGGIILMHNGEPATLAALPTIITELRAKGFRFVTIADLLGQ